jgi:hypothetical protein
VLGGVCKYSTVLSESALGTTELRGLESVSSNPMSVLPKWFNNCRCRHAFPRNETRSYSFIFSLIIDIIDRIKMKYL